MHSLIGGSMKSCENKDICCYFSNVLMDSLSEREQLESKYCNANKHKCARYVIKKRVMQGYMLPDDHDLDRVGKLLSDLRPEDMGIANRIVNLMVN